MKVILILMAVLAVPAAALIWKNTQTPSNLGLTDGRLAPLSKSPNAVSSQTDNPEKQVAPFPFKGNQQASKASIKRALSAYGNCVLQSETEDYIHAVCTTPIFRFKDDLEFFFLEQEQVVHFRSASRTGYSDLGLNRKRYKRLLEFYTSQ